MESKGNGFHDNGGTNARPSYTALLSGRKQPALQIQGVAANQNKILRVGT